MWADIQGSCSVVKKPENLGFCLARDTVGVVVKWFAMTSVKGQKEGAVTMGNGLAEMHAQRPVSRSCHQVGRAIGWQSERQE